MYRSLNVINYAAARLGSFTNDTILRQAEITDHANFPKEEAQLLSYGIEEMQSMGDHFETTLLKIDCNINDIPR